MKNSASWEEVKKELLQNPETASAYDDLKEDILLSLPSSPPV